MNESKQQMIDRNRAHTSHFVHIHRGKLVDKLKTASSVSYAAGFSIKLRGSV